MCRAYVDQGCWLYLTISDEIQFIEQNAYRQTCLSMTRLVQLLLQLLRAQRAH
jgi:hypothetical protein